MNPSPWLLAMLCVPVLFWTVLLWDDAKRKGKKKRRGFEVERRER